MKALLSVTGLFMALFAGVGVAHAAEYPTKPITLVVPQPPGGAADAVARPFAAGLSKRLGQSVIVENRPGANGNIAAAHVARQQPADGYTIFFGSISTLAVNPHLYRAVGFDPLRDFQPITLTNQTPNVLVVGASSPYDSVAAIVAAATAKPGALNYGSAGNGNTMHLTGIQFEAGTGTQLTHVPYKGGPAALNDVLAGHIPMMFHNLGAVLSFHNSGQVRILAVADNERSPLLPDVPTMEEAGAKGVVQLAWSGMLVRSGTPEPIVERLHAAMVEILEDPGFRQPQEELGQQILTSTPQEFAERLRTDHAAMAEVIKAGNVHID